MRFTNRFLLLLSLPLLAAVTAQAQFYSHESIKIQFAPAKVPEGVTWSPSASLTGGGLFTEKLPPDTSAEVWVQSHPIPAGLSWRPPTGAQVGVEVEAGAADFTFLNAYFRYSCDRVHWTSWYNLAPGQSQGRVAGSVYEGALYLPRKAREAYTAKMQEWWKTNPPWSSDEHELSVWIAAHDRDFFSREFPFIGYVQVRVEGETGGMRLKSLSIKVSSAVSGLRAFGEERGRKSKDEKWFFDAGRVGR